MANAFMSLAFVTGVRLAHRDDAWRWLAFAEPVVERLGAQALQAGLRQENEKALASEVEAWLASHRVRNCATFFGPERLFGHEELECTDSGVAVPFAGRPGGPLDAFRRIPGV